MEKKKLKADFWSSGAFRPKNTMDFKHGANKLYQQKLLLLLGREQFNTQLSEAENGYLLLCKNNNHRTEDKDFNPNFIVK